MRTLDVCSFEELPPGAARVVAAGDTEVAVFNDGGEVYALDNACAHTGGPLVDGLVRDGVVTCPMHWWRFDLATGRRKGADHIRQRTFPVDVVDGRVVVNVPEAQPPMSMREMLLQHALEWNADQQKATREIRAVIWDMGGILYKTPFERFDEIEVELGLKPGVLPRGPFAPGGDPEYAKISTGEISEAGYFTDFSKTAERLGAPPDLLDRIDWTTGMRPEVMAAIDRIAPHFLQATLSNDSSRWLGEHWWETWPHRHRFASVIDVKTLGVRKPHPDTYLASATALDVEPVRCLFVDDMQVNVDGANAVGMEGFFFDHTDVEGSLARLYARLGLDGSGEE